MWENWGLVSDEGTQNKIIVKCVYINSFGVFLCVDWKQSIKIKWMNDSVETSSCKYHAKIPYFVVFERQT